MPQIGLSKLVYAPITEGENGHETYGEVKEFCKPTSVKLSIETASGEFSAGDEVLYSEELFSTGSLEVGADDLLPDVLADLVDATVDANGVVINHGEGHNKYVAVGLQSEKANHADRLLWLYRVKFKVPAGEYKTKASGAVEFTNPTISGVIFRRRKPDAKNKHPWQAHVDTDDTKAASIVETYLDTVYEPTYTK